MIYKAEKSEKKEFDYVLNDTIYFSIIGEDSDIKVNYSCEYLTKMESLEVITAFINKTLRNSINRIKNNENRI